MIITFPFYSLHLVCLKCKSQFCIKDAMAGLKGNLLWEIQLLHSNSSFLFFRMIPSIDSQESSNALIASCYFVLLSYLNTNMDFDLSHLSQQNKYTHNTYVHTHVHTHFE